MNKLQTNVGIFLFTVFMIGVLVLYANFVFIPAWRHQIEASYTVGSKR